MIASIHPVTLIPLGKTNTLPTGKQDLNLAGCAVTIKPDPANITAVDQPFMAVPLAVFAGAAWPNPHIPPSGEPV